MSQVSPRKVEKGAVCLLLLHLETYVCLPTGHLATSPGAGVALHDALCHGFVRQRQRSALCELTPAGWDHLRALGHPELPQRPRPPQKHRGRPPAGPPLPPLFHLPPGPEPTEPDTSELAELRDRLTALESELATLKSTLREALSSLQRALIGP